MDSKYIELWKLAKPYYKKGRIYDIPHIEWMMGEAEKLLTEEDLRSDILLPIVILHDIGYSKVGKANPSVKDQESKKIHMAEGAKITREFMIKLDFPTKIVDQVAYLVSVHDNWLFGDNKVFHEIPEMAAFNDLDFIWPFSSPKQFKITSESMGMSAEEAFNFWQDDEKLKNRPLCCKFTEELYERLRKDIRKSLSTQCL